jgi:hypothetical protein
VNRGYNVRYNFVPMPGGKGQFEVSYVENGDNKTIVFTNNHNLKRDGVVVGLRINEANSQQIVDLLQV